VPDDFIAAPGIPRTLTGKKIEVPIKRIMQGVAAVDAVAGDALDRPELVEWFSRFAVLARGGK
jgi:acetoacetyl-CoA synthetase